MLHKLNPLDYTKVRPLFQGVYLTLMIDSVLAGTSSGTIWVDDPAQPQTALLWDNAYCLYLVGQAGNQSVNRQLAELYTTELAPAARGRGIDGFKILYSSADWEQSVAVVLPTLTLTQYPRVVYTLGGGERPNWRSQLPPGFAIRPIDQALLNDATLGNHADLVEEIDQCWPSQGHFLNQGFGYCLVGNHEIICRCTAEYVSPGKCGIGIATAEPYRRQGFATLTASAFLDECLARAITPYWDAWLRNTASVATAEKIGLRRVQEYQVYLGALS